MAGTDQCDDPAPDMRTTRGPLSYTALATSLPGIAALALAALYTLGALLTMADLRAAGLAVHDTLPLIPITDLLARGIGVAAAAAAALIGLMLFAQCYRHYDDYASPSLRQTLWWGGGVSLIFGSLALATYVLPAVIGLGFVAGVITLFVCELGLDLSAPAALATAYIVVVGSFAVNTVVAPQPLPIARVELIGGNSTVGPLVTSANGRWSLGGRQNEIAVIPDDEVKSVVIRSRRAPSIHRDIRRLAGVAWWVPAIVLFALLVGLVARQGAHLGKPIKDLIESRRNSH